MNFDFLITDLKMPHMDDIELIRQVRNRLGLRLLPIIMLTSEAQEEKRQEGRLAFCLDVEALQTGANPENYTST